MGAVARVIRRVGKVVAWLGALTAVLSVPSFSFQFIAAARKFWVAAILVGLAMGLIATILERAAESA